MRIILAFWSIFIALVASAQEQATLTSQGLESVRPRMVPYTCVADAKSGLVSGCTSRYAIDLTEWNIVKGESGISYTSHFAVNVGWLNRQVLLRVGFADKALRVVVNGREVGYIACGAYGSELNITKSVHEGRNEVQLIADNHCEANRLFNATSQIKGVKKSDIANVEVLCQPTIRLRDVISRTRLNSVGDGVVEVAVPIKCDALNRKTARIHYTLRLNDTTVVADGYHDISLAMRAEDTLRFTTPLPKNMLWSATSPVLLQLDIENRIENRVAECVSRMVAFRAEEIKGDKLYINGAPVALRLAEWGAVTNLDEVVKFGYNGIVIDCGYGFEKVIAECERRGLYVVVRAPIDTISLGEDIRKGGNPTNDPRWGEAFAERCAGIVNATKGSGAVVGYMLGKGKTCGVNIYDSYLLVKSLATDRIIIYEGANGEWCSDRVPIR